MSDLILGGHLYRVVSERDTTLRHYQVQVAALAAGGVDTCLPEQGEDAAAYEARLMQRIVQGGKVVELASAFLLPADVGDADWTPDLHAVIRERLGNLRDGERDKVYRLALEVTFGFFLRASRSLATSLSFTPAPGSSEASGDAAASITASGPESSGSSPAATTTAH